MQKTLSLLVCAAFLWQGAPLEAAQVVVRAAPSTRVALNVLPLAPGSMGAMAAPALTTLSVPVLPVSMMSEVQIAAPILPSFQNPSALSTLADRPAFSAALVQPSFSAASPSFVAPQRSGGNAARTSVSAPPAEAETRAAVSGRLSELGNQTTSIARNLPRLSAASGSAAARAQFDALLGVKPSSRADLVVGIGIRQKTPNNPLLHKGPIILPEDSAMDEPPEPPTSRWRVFRDKERNGAFWRLFLGEQLFMFGFQMYMVALPYLMQSFTRNTLRESGRETTAEALNQIVRENRSLARIAHWISQAVAYVAIPLFTQDDSVGPKKWLVRTALLRAAILAGVPAIFFASGLVSATTALYILLGLIGLQSFFQGIFVTMMSSSTARLIGHPSVRPSERMRANAIRSFAVAVMAVVAPALAGKLIASWDGIWKAGSGSAFIYGIYAASLALAGLVFASIRMLGGKQEGVPSVAGENKISSAGGALRHVFVSMLEGLKLIFKNRFLLTMLASGLVASLFTDPLIFNVLPEFVEKVMTANPGTMEGLLQIPVLGWFLDGLISTPMGFFALLITFASIGSVLASLLIGPLRAFFTRWFKTEEALTIPFYLLAVLQVPAFWWMTSIGSVWGVLLLYGIQSFITGFSGLILTGIYQKKLRRYTDRQMNQVLAANSFISILAAIASTFLYGFVLGNIPIATSLLIAGAATTAFGLLTAASPWLMFNKAERSGMTPSHTQGEKPENHPTDRKDSENMPNARGPHSPGF